MDNNNQVNYLICSQIIDMAPCLMDNVRGWRLLPAAGAPPRLAAVPPFLATRARSSGGPGHEGSGGGLRRASERLAARVRWLWPCTLACSACWCCRWAWSGPVRVCYRFAWWWCGSRSLWRCGGQHMVDPSIAAPATVGQDLRSPVSMARWHSLP